MKKETLTGLSIITFAAFYIWIQSDSNSFYEEKDTELEQARKTSKIALLTKCQETTKPMLKNLNSMEINRKNTDYRLLNNGNFKVTTHYYAKNSVDTTPLVVVDCLFDKDGNLLETIPDSV